MLVSGNLVGVKATKFALFSVSHSQTEGATTGIPSSVRAVNIFDIA